MDTMKFIDITTDARTQFGEFFKGERRKVSAEIAGYLVGNAWAKPAPVTLEVSNATLGVEAEDAG